MNLGKKLIYTLLAASALGLGSLCAQPLAVYPQGDFTVHIDVVDMTQIGQSSGAKEEAETSGEEKQEAKKPFKFALLKTIDVVKMQNVFSGRLTWSKGPATEVWRDAVTGFWIERHTNGSAYVNRESSLTLPELASVGTSSISWITSESLKKEITIKGKKCLHYERLMVFPGGIKIPYQAWIEVETLLPVALDDGTSRYEFTFGSEPPKDVPSMPAELRAELDRYNRALRRPPRL